METKIVAKGSIYALLSKLIFLFCGFIIHIFLARRLGPEIYGLYALVMSMLIWVELTVLVGIPSTYRKVVSEDSAFIDSTMYSLKRTFIPYCLIVLVVFSFAAPLVSNIFNDDRLLFLLLIAGIDIPFFGMYSANVSILNGHREFLKESVSMSLYALFKVILVILLIQFGFGLQGAFIGNILASFFGFLVAFSFVKRQISQRSKREIFDLKPRIVKFGLPFLLFILTTMLIIHMDMWFLKGLFNDDAMIGYYSVSSNLSKPIYFLIIGIIAVTFPAFSKAVCENNMFLSQKYIMQSMRTILVILLPLAVLVFSTSDELIILLFTSEYLPASNSLKILLFGISFFSIFSLFQNLIAAANKPFHSFIISLCLIPIAIVLNYFFINSYGIEGAAMATAGASFIGLIISGVYIWRRYGVIIKFTTLSRVILASGCLYVVSKYITFSGYYLMLEYFLLSLIYLILLLVLREIKSGDLRIVREALIGQRIR